MARPRRNQKQAAETGERPFGWREFINFLTAQDSHPPVIFLPGDEEGWVINSLNGLLSRDEDAEIKPPRNPEGLIHIIVTRSMNNSSIEEAEYDRCINFAINEAGSTVDELNKDGETPFLTASKFTEVNAEKLLRVLVKHGADPSAKDKYQKTALHMVLEHETRVCKGILYEPIDVSWKKERWEECPDFEQGGFEDAFIKEFLSDFSGDSGRNDSRSIYSLETLSAQEDAMEAIPGDDRLQVMRRKLLYLLRCGCDPKAEDCEGRSVSHYGRRTDWFALWLQAQMIHKSECEAAEKSQQP